MTVLPANASASMDEIVSSAADPTIALMMMSAPLAASTSVFTGKATLFEPGSREPSVMSCSAFFHAAARSWATCPVPRIPSFILFCSLSLCYCCCDEVVVAAGHMLNDSDHFQRRTSSKMILSSYMYQDIPAH